MAENRITTVPAEVLSSCGQSQVLTTTSPLRTQSTSGHHPATTSI
jgi:hypothetical protein